MTTRAEAKAEELAKHKMQALVMLVACAVIALVFTGAIAVMVTHMPNVLIDDEGVTGPWSGDVEMEWDHLVISHTADMELGNMDWEITKGKDNETVDEGTQEKVDGDLITANVGPGEYGVYLTPTGVNSGVDYDVTVREFYLAPSTITYLRWTGAFVLFFLAPLLWYVMMAKGTEKHREEYKLARLGIALTMVLSGIFAVTPWL